MTEVNKTQQNIIPSIVESWLKEIKNPKSTDFARSLYRDRLEYLVRYIQEELNKDVSFDFKKGK